MAKPFDWDSRIGKRVRLRDLHILFAVAQHGSMGKAGLHLGMTQSAVSQAIAALMRIPYCFRRRRRLRQLPLRPDSSVYSFLTLLEDQPDAKLNLTRRRALCQVRDFADARGNRGTAGIQSQIPVRRSVPILDIEDIECFKSQLHFEALTDWHTLKHR